MRFELKPILSEIKNLYQNPISKIRFEQYLNIIQGNAKTDMVLPIEGFNPMAKEHVYQKIEELEKLEAETIMSNTILRFNQSLELSNNRKVIVVLNLADDLKGSWTNTFSTDYNSKFKLNPHLSRNFCVPYFWVSEAFSEKIIQLRTLEYLNRFLFRLENSSPETLEEHLEQEIFVSMNTPEENPTFQDEQYKEILNFIKENKHSTDHDLIFNFFYKDKGSESLGYRKYGIVNKSGFDVSKYLALKRIKK